MSTHSRRTKAVSQGTGASGHRRTEDEPPRVKVRTVIARLEARYGIPRLRADRDPLDTLIETILSQATNDRNRDRAFAELKRQFPTWEAVRRAPVRQIARAIHSGGLAAVKSARIKKILAHIQQRVGSLDLNFLRRIPVEQARAFLTSLDGVGPKTAACVLLFSCQRPVFPADTHILRVTRRLGWIPENCSDERAHEILGRLIPAEKCYSAHINLIRLGRDVCRPRAPRCDECCLRSECPFPQETTRFH
ncbi:MAG TPA: endonuclease III [Blastocatellia bacterium]|nr:endonuclease III [Blastocatellia bacterium]